MASIRTSRLDQGNSGLLIECGDQAVQAHPDQLGGRLDRIVELEAAVLDVAEGAHQLGEGNGALWSRAHGIEGLGRCRAS